MKTLSARCLVDDVVVVAWGGKSLHARKNYSHSTNAEHTRKT